MRKNIIRYSLALLAITGAFLALRSAPVPKAEIPCEESMDQCCNKERNRENTVWETASGQFFSSASFN